VKRVQEERLTMPAPGRVIDAHSHLWQGQAPEGSLKRSIKDLDRDPRDLAGELDRLGVERVATFAQESTRVWRRWLGSNELAIDLQRHWPEVVMGVFGGEPLDEQDKLNVARLREFELAVREHRIHGLLFTPPYGHYYANDVRAYPFYKVAEDLAVPVLFHHSAAVWGEPVLCPMKFARPWLLDDLASDFPALRVLVEHMGHPWTEELLALMAHAPNFHTDISTLQRRPILLAWNLVMAREYGVLDRVMWGTDYVGEDHGEYAALVEREVHFVRHDLNAHLARSGWPVLSEDEVDGLLRRNAMRFYGLE
jgi:predicted TIM-barrel fold metal-dependent hydrolase